MTRRAGSIPVARIVLAAVVLLGGALAVADEVVNADHILPGVRVGPIRVGGMARDAAARLLARRLSGSREIELVWAGGMKKVLVFGGDFGIDTEAAAESAYEAGRTGDLFSRLGARVSALGGGYRVEVVPRPIGAVRTVLKNAHAALDRRAIDAHFTFLRGKVEIVPDKPGKTLNDARAAVEFADAFLSARQSAYMPMTRVPPHATTIQAMSLLPIARRWVAKPANVAVGRHRIVLPRASLVAMLAIRDRRLRIDPAALARSLIPAAGAVRAVPTNARFSVVNRRVYVIGGTAGRSFDPSTTAARLGAALNSGRRSIVAAVRSIHPTITRGDLKALRITRLLGTFTTRFRLGADGRDTNISLAARAVRGKVVSPGQVFSLNQATGPRNRATGYRESLGFLNGKVVPTVGGGTCQVSSTLYEAALLANLRIVARNNHSMAVGYMPPGRDATTFYPTVDLKFQNNRPGAILLWSEVRKRFLTIQVYGSGPRQEVTIETIVRKTVPPKRLVVYTSSLKSGVREVEVEGRPGYIVSSYRIVRQGKRVVRREFLANDRYRPKNWVIRVGS